MAKGSQGLTWLQMGLSPGHRVCSGCGQKLKLEQVWHWNGTDRTVFGLCCPAFTFVPYIGPVLGAAGSTVTSGDPRSDRQPLAAFQNADPGDEDGQ